MFMSKHTDTYKANAYIVPLIRVVEYMQLYNPQSIANASCMFQRCTPCKHKLASNMYYLCNVGLP